MSVYRYSQWDGSQEILELDADELMDRLGCELMSQGNLAEALRMLQRKGIKDSQGKQLPGLEELLQRLRQMKQNQLDKDKLSSLMDEIRQRLEEIIAAEREGIQQRLEEARQKASQEAGELSPEERQRLLKTLEDMAAEDLKNLEELAERLQDQIDRAQSLLDRLSTEDMELLGDLLRSVLDEDDQNQLARMTANQDARQPGDELSRQQHFSGEKSGAYPGLLELMEMLQKMNKLESQLEDALQNRSLDVVDEKLLKELMGDEAAEEMEKLRCMAKVLEEAGYIHLKGDKYQLTPRGMRKIGQKALEDIFDQFRKDHVGGHNLNQKGPGGERIDETKQYEVGDEFRIHLQKTMMNSLYREPGRLPVKLNLEDFEVFKTEGMTWSATVLMLDLSVSMPMRGNFEAAKRVAIALDGLIRSKYPRDSLYIVGFSSYARQIKKEDLSYMNWDEFDPYTNLQQGLFLARKLLAKERNTNKQIILVTDGEPTAHHEGGDIFFHNNPRTIQVTLREVRNCTRKGIVINTFMLESSQYLSAFATQMTRLNKGRLFYTSADDLGQYLLVDYISNKRRRLEA